MMEEPFERDWKKKSRVLTHALLISGTLNVGLLGTFIYSAFKTSAPSEERVLSKSNAEIIEGYFDKSFEELTRELLNEEPLRDGYRRRDLALACLAGYHNFNLEKALSGFPFQRRRMSYTHESGESISIDLFPALRDEHFEAIYSFIKQEKWPLTAEGLFYEMQRQRPQIDSTLQRAFLASPHYYTVRALLSRSQVSLTEDEIFALLLDGEWSVIKAFFEAQMASPDLSDEVRVDFLRAFLPCQSKIAAHLLVQGEQTRAGQVLSDLELSQVVELLSRENPQVHAFLQQLAKSSQNSELRQKSVAKLQSFGHRETPVQKEMNLRKYVVREGDSLWKIAKRFKVDIDALARINRLEKSHFLKVGMELEVPRPRHRDATDGT